MCIGPAPPLRPFTAPKHPFILRPSLRGPNSVKSVTIAIMRHVDRQDDACDQMLRQAGVFRANQQGCGARHIRSARAGTRNYDPGQEILPVRWPARKSISWTRRGTPIGGRSRSASCGGVMASSPRGCRRGAEPPTRFVGGKAFALG